MPDGLWLPLFLLLVISPGILMGRKTIDFCKISTYSQIFWQECDILEFDCIRLDWHAVGKDGYHWPVFSG